MKYCKNCGNSIDDNAIFCPCCGTRTNGEVSANNSYGASSDPFGDSPYGNPYGNPYGGYNPYGYHPVDMEEKKWVSIVSFILWPAGLIMWLFWRNTRPGKARSALKGLMSVASFNIPLLGLIFWLVWRNDPTKKEYAKICGISAIAGAIYLVVFNVLDLIFGFTEYFTQYYEDMLQSVGDTATAFISKFIK